MSQEVRVGKKSKSEYVSSCLYAFDNSDDNEVVVAGLGGQLSKALDVAEDVEEIKNVTQTEKESFRKDGLTGIRITLEKEE